MATAEIMWNDCVEPEVIEEVMTDFLIDGVLKLTISHGETSNGYFRHDSLYIKMSDVHHVRVCYRED